MPSIVYVEKNFRADSLQRIEDVNIIITDYKKQGYDLTLRQVYYQLVAGDIIPNSEHSYKNLGTLINDVRLAGLVDWYAINDRTRYLRKQSHWDSPSDVIRSAKYSFLKDKWKNQEYYVEVWVEKDALIGIVGSICDKLDVPHFSCRGYVSQSEMWRASQRLIEQAENGKECVILHLGDHDPSGIDMSRDITDRLNLFGADIEFKRIALNMEQIDLYNPPPNPAKLSDSRARSYIHHYGHSSWELDALKPDALESLIRSKVERYIDRTSLSEIEHDEKMGLILLDATVERWFEIEKFLQE